MKEIKEERVEMKYTKKGRAKRVLRRVLPRSSRYAYSKLGKRFQNDQKERKKQKKRRKE